MDKLSSKNGLTLIELVVASFLIIVVILGIFSINTALNNNGLDYGQKYLIRSQTQNTLNHILNNVALAKGDGSTDSSGNLDQGVWVGAGPQSKWDIFQASCSICVHQAANNNLIGSGSDIWLCYTWYPPGKVAGEDYQIRYCAMAFNPAGNLRGAANCATAGDFGIALLSGPTYLGSARSEINMAATWQPATPLFSLTLTNCMDNAKSSCQASGVSTDPSKNPEVQLTGNVTPLLEST